MIEELWTLIVIDYTFAKKNIKGTFHIQILNKKKSYKNTFLIKYGRTKGRILFLSEVHPECQFTPFF